MAITPIERISIPTKSNEVSKIKTPEQRGEAASLQLAAALKAQNDLKMQRTEKKDDVDKEKDSFDAKEKGNGQGESNREREKKKIEKERADEEIRRAAMGSRFNITV